MLLLNLLEAGLKNVVTISEIPKIRASMDALPNGLNNQASVR
jgi:hypothetical protein